MQISTDHPVSISLDSSQEELHHICSEQGANSGIQSIEFYQAAISADESIVSNYWYLGLSYLLVGKAEDAQAIWFVPLAGANQTELEIYTDRLWAILDREATSRSQLLDLEAEWAIRQQLWMLKPDRVQNILQLIVLADALDLLTVELLIDLEVDRLLATISTGIIDDKLLEQTISALLEKSRTDLGLKIIRHCLSLVVDRQHQLASRLINIALNLFYQQNLELFSIRLVEICSFLQPDDLKAYKVLSCFYSEVSLHTQATVTAEQFSQLATNQFERLLGSYLVQRSYLTAGNWQGYQHRLDFHRELLATIIDNQKGDSPKNQDSSLIISSFFTPYIEDNPRIDKPLQNKLAQIYQDSLNPLPLISNLEEIALEKKPDTIRIGYLASTLREHSVGWLSRWLFHYHDRASFQIFAYCINQNSEDTFNHQWFRDKVDVSYYLNGNLQEIVAQIKTDRIDILIDLDSLTSDLSCLIVAHKPAPFQVTWLGLDASGLPAIDYFIADPYVLPDDAQDYYQEKIWRLPQTYLAVDGFEVGTPTLNRQDLGIPDDAVVYFSSQGGYKRHPDHIRCQMRIIKAVPNSYLLIKGKSDSIVIEEFFGKIAKEEGVSIDRLRFLAGVPSEYIHRANLAIADIVLDTFPYNGATTTLETLWMQ
jgi:predicted O-linked N-acetylglucosamine transferase (SPINDLY family)